VSNVIVPAEPAPRNQRRQLIAVDPARAAGPLRGRALPADARINLTPVELPETHGKSPVIAEGDRVVAKSGAIIDHVVRGYDDGLRNLL
jgi:hypothetical protein